MLLVATITIFIWSFFDPALMIHWGDGHQDNGYVIWVLKGGVNLQREHALLPMVANVVVRPKYKGNEWDHFGFSYEKWDVITQTFDGRPLPGVYGTVTGFWFSLMWLNAVSFNSPARWLASPSTWRRNLKNETCGKCGYDLRATPERCPECGTLSGTCEDAPGSTCEGANA